MVVYGYNHSSGGQRQVEPGSSLPDYSNQNCMFQALSKNKVSQIE